MQNSENCIQEALTNICFKNLQAFALDGGVSFKTFTRSDDWYAGGVLISALKCSI